MADDRYPQDEGSLVSRLLQDPVRLRRWSRWTALALVGLVALASDGLDGNVPGMLFPLAWLLLPFVAIGVGYGDAFFIRHGIGIRLEIVMLVGGVFIALTSCVLLSTIAEDAKGTLQRVVEAVLYGLLYGGLLSLLAAFVGFGLGRGLDYTGRRIESMEDEDW